MEMERRQRKGGDLGIFIVGCEVRLLLIVEGEGGVGNLLREEALGFDGMGCEDFGSAE